MTLYDVVGTFGVILVLVSYGALQLGRMSATGLTYSLMNLLGSLAILYSLIFQWNLASFIIEIAWTFISLYGLCKCISQRNKARSEV